MGWFWGKGDDGDAVRNLDPKLKDFLDKESPATYIPPTTSTAPTPTPPASKEATESQPEKPYVPAESQFQDGRYAHLWKTYTPQVVVDQKGKTDQEKLSDIVAAYNVRRGDIGRTALENCALENFALHDCYRNGAISDRMTNCRKQLKSLDKCYSMQQKFLQALGYLSVMDRSEEEQERIQMHADKLYHQMLEREEMIEKAQKEGRPLPQFAPLFSAKNISAAVGGKPIPLDTEGASQATPTESRPAIWNEVPASTRSSYEARLKDKTGLARDVEIQAITAEIEATKELGKEVSKVFEEERRNRLARKEAGKETLGDTLKRWWGW